MAFTAGQTLYKGKYTIDRPLNQGRFGISYLAHDKRNQKVVIKTFRDDVWQNLSHADQEKNNNRLLREAGVLGGCKHPHIVNFHPSFLEQGQACLVMEYIDGQDLASIATQKLPVDTALEYIRQIGSALQELHSKGLVHRDVKPANIMLRAGKPEVVLIDFGLAGNQDDTITMNETTREKGFTAPELYDPNEKAQPYTDVYSLGATLYAFLSGQAPPSVQERSRIGKNKLPALPSTVDKGIYEAIARAMELNWKKRLKTVDEFLGLLNLPVAEVVAVNSPDQNPVPDLQELALKETRKQTRIAVISIVITLAVTILLGLFAQELKSFLMSPFQPSAPEQKSE